MVEKENKNNEELKLDEEMKIIEVATTTTIKQLADKIGVSATEVIKTMMKKRQIDEYESRN